MEPGFTVTHDINRYSIVEFTTISLMDPIQLDHIAKSLYRLVDEEDRRRLILDFGRVQYVASQAIGIIMALRKKLDALQFSTLVLCGAGPKLREVLKITCLDKTLTIKPSQKEAVRVLES